MAVARKIKTLLTVNILVFVGIVLFSVYCRLQGRSRELVRIVGAADRRVRSRHAKVGALGEREAILQRLDHLEEVVYNQLNGERGRQAWGGDRGRSHVHRGVMGQAGLVWAPLCASVGGYTRRDRKGKGYGGSSSGDLRNPPRMTPNFLPKRTSAGIFGPALGAGSA
ncbi:hypothetical protein P7K49_020690 [Saguinus oedipus]|uniref:Uncharacterized protein n=1 Tax=Saguinus oedipus TaxID=9490 RepID=A0ABQ9V0U7_SAGOE|nr:hypothetical protein P7K49_020690 [Saguinus oedipus]